MRRSSTMRVFAVLVEDDGPLADRRELVRTELRHACARCGLSAPRSNCTQRLLALGGREHGALRAHGDLSLVAELGDRVAAAPVERQLVARGDRPELALGRQHRQHVAAVGDLRGRGHVDALDERGERRVDALDRADARVVDERVAAVLEHVDLVRRGRDGRVELFDLTVQPAREQFFGVGHPDLAGVQLGIGDGVALVQHREAERHAGEHRDGRAGRDRFARAKPRGEPAHDRLPRASVGRVRRMGPLRLASRAST